MMPNEEQERVSTEWYRKYCVLSTKIWKLHKEIYNTERYEYEIAVRGLMRLGEGFHLQMSGLLSERTTDIQILVDELEKSFEFIESRYISLMDRWEASKSMK